jgi:type IV secretory pathway VirB3-like protein
MLETRTIWCLMGIAFLFGIRLSVLGFGLKNCFLAVIGLIIVAIIVVILYMVAAALSEEDDEKKYPPIWYGN